MCQRKSGSDDCEHEFAGCRVRNSKPTQQDMRQITARRTGTRASTFTSVNKANTRGDSDIYTDEISKPIFKKSRRKINI